VNSYQNKHGSCGVSEEKMEKSIEVFVVLGKVMFLISWYFHFFHCKMLSITSKHTRKTSDLHTIAMPSFYSCRCWLQPYVFLQYLSFAVHSLQSAVCSDYPCVQFQGVRVQRVSLKIEHKLCWGWEWCSWTNIKYNLIGSKDLLTLTFIKSMLNKRKQVQHFFSLPNPPSFCWTRPFNSDLLSVGFPTFIHCSRSLFVLENLSDQTNKSYFMEICKKWGIDFPKSCMLFDLIQYFMRIRVFKVLSSIAYCVGSELHWILVDTCRRNQWRCRPCRSHWSHMFLHCGKGLDGKGLCGKGGKQC